MAIFCVNKSMDDSMVVDINLMDFDGYKPCEFISMDGCDRYDENTFDTLRVKPHNNPVPAVDGTTLTLELRPFSWNVIRLKK